MAENVDHQMLVPPSPVASSTQIPHIRGNFPLLPRLPSLDLEVDLNVPIPSTSALSPIPIVYAGQDENQPLDIDNNRRRSASTGVLGVQDWVIHERTHQGARHRIQIIGDVIEVEDESSRSSSANSDVISVGDGSSDIQHVSDSDIDTLVDEDEDSEADTGIARPINLEPQADIIDIVSRAEAHNIVGTETSTSQATPQNPLLTSPGEAVATLPSTLPTVQSVQIFGAQGRSPADFRSPKRKRVHSPEKSSDGDKKGDAEEEEDGDCCPICFETWTTSGLHRLCSLKCGHLFGQSCIEKWLKGQGGKCPHCNAKAKRQDIRVLYAKSVKALDTSELNRALKDLEKEKEGKRRAEMEGAQLRLQYQMVTEENNRLKLELENMKVQLKKSGVSTLSSSGLGKKLDASQGSLQSKIAGQYLLERTVKIWDAGNCRVMAYCPSLATIVASQPSSSPLFPGFGVKKICTLDFKTSQYLTIHSKPIRDVAFHPTVEDGMLLSCGLDKKVKMTSLLSNAVVQSYDTPMPAWSCVWNGENRNYFFAGLQNGLVLEFDIRNTDSAVQEFNNEGSRSPVNSLCFLCRDARADFPSGGLLIGQLDRVSFFEQLPSNQHKLHLLPLEGSLTSLHVEPNTRHILASYRPAGRHPTIRHQVCELISRNISTDPSVINNVCSCNVVHTFHGSRTQTILSKTIIQQHPGDTSRLLVCAGDESSNSVHLWDSATGQLAQRLIMGGVTVDMCSFKINNTSYLAALTDKQCKVFKWT